MKYFIKEAATLPPNKMLYQAYSQEMFDAAQPTIDSNLKKVKKVDKSKTPEIVKSRSKVDEKRWEDYRTAKAKEGGRVLGTMSGLMTGMITSPLMYEKWGPAGALGGAAIATGAGIGINKLIQRSDKKQMEKVRPNVKKNVAMRNAGIRMRMADKMSKGHHVYADPSLLDKSEY